MHAQKDQLIQRSMAMTLWLTGGSVGEGLAPGSRFRVNAGSDLVVICGQGTEACGHTVSRVSTVRKGEGSFCLSARSKLK